MVKKIFAVSMAVLGLLATAKIQANSPGAKSQLASCQETKKDECPCGSDEEGCLPCPDDEEPDKN